jgi:hypothetical protein
MTTEWKQIQLTPDHPDLGARSMTAKGGPA